MTQKLNNRRCSKQFNNSRSLKKPERLQRRKPKNEKHEMEVEIEKVVKAQKDAQSATEVADREENAHNKESRAQAIAEEDARRIAGATRPSAKDAQEIIQFERVDHEQGRREATASIESQERRVSCEAA